MLSDKTTTLHKLRKILMDFSYERNWHKRKNPQQIAKSLIIECGELLQEFQWMDDKKSKSSLSNVFSRKKIVFELVDVLYYLLTLFDIYEADVTKSTLKKLDELKTRYPSLRKNEKNNSKKR